MARRHHNIEAIARRAMIERGFRPEFSREVMRAIKHLDGPARIDGNPRGHKAVRDLRELQWCSIDNDDSRDIDQVTVAEELASGATKIRVGIADVDALVPLGGPVDEHARVNTTSVYTGVRIYPMLPEELSTDLTSLNEGEDRLAIVVEMVVGKDGEAQSADIYRATVTNNVQLAYNSVALGLETEDPLMMPEEVRNTPGLDAQLRLQDRVAQCMKKVRHLRGALDFESIEPRAVVDDGNVVDLVHEPKNRARELIEDFMIGANTAVALFLEENDYPSLRRVVRSPERWEKIANVAATYHWELPYAPDSVALSEFLDAQRERDPDSFPDLSRTIVKLMGRGEYVVEMPGEEPTGHFGLAVRDYAHSTAPNRRYPDLITQRIVKSALARKKAPYNQSTLEKLAGHCTLQENAADKVERQVRKSAAALLLSDRIGERFDGIVTGASQKGTWARAFHPPVEGKVVRGARGLDVGDRVRVKLLRTDVERGFIDFGVV